MAVLNGVRMRGPTVAEFLGQWLAHVRGRVRPKTYTGYESLLRINAIPAIGRITLVDLRPLDLQCVYSQLLGPERGLAAGSVLNLHLVLTDAISRPR